MPAPLSDIHEELDFLSDLLSNRVRTIALSVLAMAWLFLSGGDSSPKLPVVPERGLLLAAGGLSIGALVVDYIQYVFGWLATTTVRRAAEKSTKEAADFNYKDWRFKVREIAFWVKQVLMLLALVLLGIAVFSALF